MNNKKPREAIERMKIRLDLLEEEIRNDVSVPVVASFGFIIALVWRDAVKGIIDEFLSRAGLLKDAYIYNVISALIVTVVVIIIMISITRFSRRRKKERIKEHIDSVHSNQSKQSN